MPKRWPSIEKCSSGQATSTEMQNTGTQTNESQSRHSMTEIHEVLTNTSSVQFSNLKFQMINKHLRTLLTNTGTIAHFKNHQEK